MVVRAHENAVVLRSVTLQHCTFGKSDDDVAAASGSDAASNPQRRKGGVRVFLSRQFGDGLGAMATEHEDDWRYWMAVGYAEAGAPSSEDASIVITLAPSVPIRANEQRTLYVAIDDGTAATCVRPHEWHLVDDNILTMRAGIVHEAQDELFATGYLRHGILARHPALAAKPGEARVHTTTFECCWPLVERCLLKRWCGICEARSNRSTTAPSQDKETIQAVGVGYDLTSVESAVDTRNVQRDTLAAKVVSLESVYAFIGPTNRALIAECRRDRNFDAYPTSIGLLLHDVRLPLPLPATGSPAAPQAAELDRLWASPPCRQVWLRFLEEFIRPSYPVQTTRDACLGLHRSPRSVLRLACVRAAKSSHFYYAPWLAQVRALVMDACAGKDVQTARCQLDALLGSGPQQTQLARCGCLPVSTPASQVSQLLVTALVQMQGQGEDTPLAPATRSILRKTLNQARTIATDALLRCLADLRATPEQIAIDRLSLPATPRPVDGIQSFSLIRKLGAGACTLHTRPPSRTPPLHINISAPHALTPLLCPPPSRSWHRVCSTQRGHGSIVCAQTGA